MNSLFPAGDTTQEENRDLYYADEKSGILYELKIPQLMTGSFVRCTSSLQE